MRRNARIESILQQILLEMRILDNSDFKWTPDPTILLDGKWAINPEYQRVIQLQKDLLWELITQNSAGESERRFK
jgi:hypothetical protein